MDHDYAFIAPVLLSRGGMTPHKLPLPAEIGGPLRAAKVRRIVGALDGQPFRLGLQYSRADGFAYVALSRDRMRALDVEAGALVEVELSADPEPDRVDLGAELEAALAADAEARSVWDSLTPGTRRAYAHTVTSAKREATRTDRAATVVAKLRDGTHDTLRRRW